MADIFSVESFNTQTINEEEDSKLNAFDFDSSSSSNPAFFIPSFEDFDRGPDSVPESSDSESDYSDFYDDEDQMSYVTDLFHSQNESVLDHPHVVNSNSYSRVLPDCEEVGFGSEFDGLRVVGADSESDSEDVEASSGVIDPSGDSGVPGFWSRSRVDEDGDLSEEFEWEEIDEMGEERDNDSYLIDRMEEISVSSYISSEEGTSGLGDDGEEEQMRNLEWELLAAVNNLERSLEVVMIQGVGVYEAEYNALFGALFGSEGMLKGSPPAAKSVVENLPLVVLKDEELRESNAACAVCKDEILVADKVTRLPCSHYYHCDCIVPWLSLRNTCPVCRHELPTDDADYERRKNGSSTGTINDFQVRYEFEPVL